MSDIDKIRQHASALYELLKDNNNQEVTSHLRKMVFQLEMMDEPPFRVAQSARRLAGWLVQVCDAEHGVLIKHYPDQPNEMDAVNIEHHVNERTQQLHDGMALHTTLERGVKHLAGMLGVSGAQSVPVQKRLSWFASELLEHLRADRDLSKKMHQLALATMESLQSVQDMLVDIGDESPELQHVAMMLARPIPDDPLQARDYLKQISQHLQHIQHTMIEGGKRMRSDIDARVQAFEDVSSQLSAAHEQERSDALTGLPNRRALIDFLTGQSQQQVMSLAILDIDQLQHINALAGEAGGNRCLCEVADLLIGRVRADDMVFRVGGDEFIVVFPGIGIAAATQAAEALHVAMDHMMLSLAGNTIHVRSSFGLAEHLPDETLHSWIKRADAALYVAKGRGGNCVASA